jgi:hypothetical protein
MKVLWDILSSLFVYETILEEGKYNNFPDRTALRSNAEQLAYNLLIGLR